MQQNDSNIVVHKFNMGEAFPEPPDEAGEELNFAVPFKDINEDILQHLHEQVSQVWCNILRVDSKKTKKKRSLKCKL